MAAYSIFDFVHSGFRPDQTLDLVKHEMEADKAASLGHHGRQVEAAMAALRAHDAAGGAGGDDRQRLVKVAAKAVWAYFVQREACGMRDQREAIKIYGIPGEVLARLGAIEK